MILALGTLLFLIPGTLRAEENAYVLPLAGEWRMKLDPTSSAGVAEKWYQQTISGDHASLPGTINDENHRTKAATIPLSPPGSNVGLGNFQPLYSYQGATWYQRDVEIPKGWAGKHVELFMESCMWETYVWVDDTFIGSVNSLATPHLYDLTKALKPGARHRITIAVDNSNLPNAMSGLAGQEKKQESADTIAQKMSQFFNEGSVTGSAANKSKHNITGHQIWSMMWNGILGRFELRAEEPLRITHADVFPQAGSNAIRLNLELANDSGVSGNAKVGFSCKLRGEPQSKETKMEGTVRLSGERTQKVELQLEPNHPLLTWDDENPRTYEGSLNVSQSGKKSTGEYRMTFGLRQLGRQDNQFTVNGRKVFMRGTVENFIFPLTGHAPVDRGTWKRLMATAKAYGLNFIRFHTCTPPEAAFEAADEAGIYLQVEVPMLTRPPADATSREIKDSASKAFIYDEFRRILKTYGNHPSFFGMTMGNEQFDNNQGFRADLVKQGQKLDPRHMYSESSGGPTHWPAGSTTNGVVSDYFVTAHPLSGTEPLAGIVWSGRRVIDSSRFNTNAPNTTYDYTSSLVGLEKPLMMHEVGQWATFPDMREITRYHGATRPFNFEIIRQRLRDNGLLEFADDFTHASGRLAFELYKEEVESALRTPGMAGFQLLQLNDYPGQSTATVGLLNSLWESKGLTSAREFRSFCGPVIPLAKFSKRTWTTEETFAATVELANYGPAEVNSPAKWSMIDELGRIQATGELHATPAPTGGLTPLGKITVPLNTIKAPTKLTLRIEVGNREPNSWNLWVYPAEGPSAPAADITVASAWNEQTKTLLRQGHKVLLVVDPSSLPPLVNPNPVVRDVGKSSSSREGVLSVPIPGNFTPVFWSPVMKHQQLAQTMGLLCDPANPALAQFPTDFHSDWQWWDPVMSSSVMCVDPLPKALRPIVQVIDNFRDNRRLAMVFEVKVGEGRLLVCSSDITKNLESRPVARQLRHSLLEYMGSGLFNPDVPASEDALDKVLLANPSPASKSSPTPPQEMVK
jgi:hypothetical protein